MPNKKNKSPIDEVVSLAVEDIAFGGFGIAHREGKTFFVNGAYPGEECKARVIYKKRGIFFAKATEIMKPIEARREPPCKIFRICGGCAIQDISYEKQFELKLKSALDALRKIGGLSYLPEPELIRAEEELNYRNKMEFSFGGEIGDIFAGLHERDSFDRLVRAQDCMLPPTFAKNILVAVAETASRMGIPRYDPRDDSGLLRHLVLRFSETVGDCLAVLSMREPNEKIALTLLEKGREAEPRLTSAFMSVNERTGDTADGKLFKLFGRGFIEEEIDEIIFRISPKSFFQTNTRMARKFYAKIIEYASETGGKNAVDLFCGTGTIAQLLAKKFDFVRGLEISRSAIDDAIESAKRNNISNVDFVCGSVEKKIDEIFCSGKPDVVVLDPPRSGISPKPLRKIIETSPKTIIYASCGPPTLARDLAILNNFYRMEKITFVDMFPQTFHIEAIVKLASREADRC